MKRGHGEQKYPAARLLGSSAGQNWPDLFAERRVHPPGATAPFVSCETELTMVLEGAAKAVWQVDGVNRAIEATPGVMWLAPAGVSDERIDFRSEVRQALHLYLTSAPFERVCSFAEGGVDGLTRLRREGPFRDPLLEEISRAVVEEMKAGTPAGRCLIASLTECLAGRLLQRCASRAFERAHPANAGCGVDERRLWRVVDYINAHLADDLSVAVLAQVACLSRSHFAHAFARAMGTSPHHFVSARRLERAKAMLTEDRHPLAAIALQCRFSNQANFTKAFMRATGQTPGQFRRFHRRSLSL